MNSPDLAPTRVRTAIALSIALHLCALWFLATQLVDRQMQTGTLDDRPTFRVTTIVHRDPAPQPRARQTATVSIVSRRAATIRPTPRPAPRRFAHIPAEAHAAGPPRKPAARGAASAGRTAAGLPRLVLALVPPVPTAEPIPSATPTVAPPTPIPTAPATAAPVTPAPVAVANFGGLFSQNYPPAFAAPSDLDAMRSRLSGRVRIRVDVDETGHATDVRFVGPVADETFAQKLRSELLALHYVPADCNGLHCDGTLEINY